MGDRERERTIVIEGRKRGLSDEFIKEAVLRDRQRRGANTTTVTEEAVEAQPIAGPVEDQGKTVMGFLGNIAKSTGRLAGNIGEAIIHPIQTARTVASLPLGLGEKIARKVDKKVTGRDGEVLPSEQALNNLLTALGERYGGKQNIQDTLYEDPVGAAADVAALLTGTGAGLRTAGRAAEVSELSKAGEIASKAGSVVDPIRQGGKVVAKTAEKVATKATERAAKLYDSILGINKNEAREVIRSGKKTTGQKIVEKGGIPGPAKTGEGIRQFASDKVDELETKVQGKLAELDNAGQKVKTADVVKPLEDMKAELANLGEPVPARLQGVIDAIKKTGDELTPSQANALKREYYSLLRGKKANFSIPVEELPSAKQIWRMAGSSLRQQIGKLDDTVNDLNAEQGLHLEIADKITDQLAKGLSISTKDAASLIGSIISNGALKTAGAGLVGGVAFGGLPGAAAGAVAEKLLTTVPAKTARAKAALKTSKAARTAGRAAGVTRNSGLNALLRAVGLIGEANE